MSESKNINPGTSDQSKPKISRKKLLLYIGIPIFVTLLLSTVTYGVHLYTKAQKVVKDSYEDVGRDNEVSVLRKDPVDPIEDNVSILILGIDESEERIKEEYFRSDTMILATFNKQDGTVKLLSIPRDSRVYVPEVDYYTKINHAHNYGGAKAAIETVEDFLQVPVDYYVRLNFKAFIEVVDAVDGIKYDVPFDMSEVDTKGKENSIHIEKGYQKLKGEKALALARTRKYDSDVERGKRQQEIIKIIAKKVTSASSIFKLDDVMDGIGNNMKTNLSFNHMKSFLSYGMDADIDMESVNLDGKGGYMDDGLWYYQVDDESRIQASNELRRHLNLPVVDKSEFRTEGQKRPNSVEQKTDPESSTEDQTDTSSNKEKEDDTKNQEDDSQEQNTGSSKDEQGSSTESSNDDPENSSESDAKNDSKSDSKDDQTDDSKPDDQKPDSESDENDSESNPDDETGSQPDKENPDNGSNSEEQDSKD